MSWYIYTIITSVCALIISAVMTYALIPWLKSKQILDIPNERSNHSQRTPRGGGIAVITALLISSIIYLFFTQNYSYEIISLLAGTLFLAIISWRDDMKPLSSLIRLLSHFSIVTCVVFFFLDEKMFDTPLLPPFFMQILIIFSWVWFINLFNFMDGIDGITCMQTLCITLAIIALHVLHTPNEAIVSLSSICVAATIGFLFWNWHPAKIFLGDVGSIPLGFLLGYLLLSLYPTFSWSLPLIVSGYYVFDSSYTLIKRLLKKEKIWLAHSEHFYQRAVRSGKKHSTVVYAIMLGNIMLMIIAIAVSYDIRYAIEGLILSALVIWGVIMFLMGHKENK